MNPRARQVGITRARAQEKGIIRKKGTRIIIIIDDVVYFVSIKALKDVLNGYKEITALWGY